MRRLATLAPIVLAFAACNEIFGITAPVHESAGGGGSTSSSSSSTSSATSSSATSSSGSTSSSSSTSSSASSGGSIGPILSPPEQHVALGPAGDGFVPCGTQAAAKSFAFSNTGDQPFTWAGALARGEGSPFSISPTGGVLPAGESVTVTVTPLAPIPVPADMTRSAYADYLWISTNIPNDFRHAVHIEQIPYGAVVTRAVAIDGRSRVDLGQVVPGSTAMAPLTFVNEGTAPVTLTLTTGTPVWSAAPSGATTLHESQTLDASVSFTPLGSAAVSDTLTLAADPGDVLCAPLPTVDLRASGPSGPVAVSPVELDFGKVDCGDKPPDQRVTLTGAVGVPSLQLAKGGASPFTVGIELGCGTGTPPTCSLLVKPSTTPTTSDTAPNGLGDVLTIQTSTPGDAPHVVPLRMTARGGILSVATDTVSFGAVPYGEFRHHRWALTNRGNTSIRIEMYSDAMVGLWGALDLPAHGARAGDIVFESSWVQGPQPTLPWAALETPGHKLCKPAPSSKLHVVATPSPLPITVDTRSGIEFPPTACGGQAAPRQFALLNGTSAVIAVSAVMAKGASSKFSVSPAADSIAAGGKLTFTVTPGPIPAVASTSLHAIHDVVVLTTDAPGDAPHLVPVQLTARGAVLEVVPAILAFGAAPAGSVSTIETAFFVVDHGNAPATGLGLVPSNTADFALSSPSSTSLAPGLAAWVSATFQPQAAGLKTGTVSLTTTGGSHCAMPGTLQLTGNGY